MRNLRFDMLIGSREVRPGLIHRRGKWKVLSNSNGNTGRCLKISIPYSLVNLPTSIHRFLVGLKAPENGRSKNTKIILVNLYIHIGYSPIIIVSILV